MIPLAIPNLNGNEAKYLQECIESSFVSSIGPFVNTLEDMTARASGYKYAVAVSSGTAGLHAGLTALGVQRDDIVIAPAFSFIATANAISYCGASPWFIDIDTTRWGMCPQRLAEALENKTKQTSSGLIHIPTKRRIKAVMPVHTLGCPANMDDICHIAQAYDLPVLADGAAALGATDRKRPIGHLGADITVLSFNGNKTITTGGGGMVLGSNPKLMNQVRHLTTTAKSKADYTHDAIGFNYRMTNVQAAIGCAQMERMYDLVGLKQQISQNYRTAFRKYNCVTPFPCPDHVESACWFSGFTLPPEYVDLIRAELQVNDIDSRPFWKPLSSHTPYRETPMEDHPVTNDIWHRIITLPCSTGLTKKEQDHVISTVSCVLEKR